jgi:hypothetical protein
MNDSWVAIVDGERGVTARRSTIQRFYWVTSKKDEGGECEVVFTNGDKCRTDCTYEEFAKRLGIKQGIPCP